MSRLLLTLTTTPIPITLKTFSASYRHRHGSIQGVLKVTGDNASATDLRFAGAEVKGRCATFDDLDDYEEAIELLQSQTELVSVCPYSDLFRPEETGPLDLMNWSIVPASTMETIMEHQKEAVEVAIEHHRGRSLVILEPGLGKTLIGVLFALYYMWRAIHYKQCKKPTVLIICPASKVIDWRIEFQQWSGLSLAGVRVRSFDEVKGRPDLLEREWDAIIVDECHKLKTETSVRAKHILPLLEACPHVIMLSGTPQENRPCELFNQLRAVRPDVFNDREMFSRRYSDGKIGSRGVWDERGSANEEELAAIMSICSYARHDVVVVATPIVRTLAYLTPTDEQREKLRAQESMRKELASAEQRARTFDEKQRIGMLRNTHANLMWRTAGVFKADVMEERVRAIVAKHPNEKIVVYCFHLKNADKVKALLDTIGQTVLVTGSTPAKKRNELLGCLRNPADPTRFGVLTIRAIGEGINLCPGVSVIVFLEIDRVPAMMKQAEKRAHRKGTTKEVSTYWFLLAESSDPENLAKLQLKELGNGTVTGGATEFVFDEEEAPPILPPPPKKVRKPRVKKEVAKHSITPMKLVKVTESSKAEKE